MVALDGCGATGPWNANSAILAERPRPPEARSNDAYFAALLGGQRRNCAAKGEGLQDVPISIPVAMRAAADAKGGNDLAAAYFLVPSSITDPTERI